MAMIVLFAVSASLPALAVSSEAPRTSADSVATTTYAADAQSLDVSAATPAPVQREGFTMTDIPQPASYTEISGDGTWASLDPSQLTEQGWALPVLGRIASAFGPRPDKPVAGVGDDHNGTDIAAPCGQPVFAAMGGTVVESGYQGSYGNWILIDHGGDIQTGYAHSSTLLVEAGQTVAPGQVIALVGTTGASTGCHLHFETRVDGTPTDPVAFMSARGVSLA